MAPNVARTGQAKSEHRICPRAARYRRIRYRVAVWTERGVARVLSSFDLVGNSGHIVGIRHTARAKGFVALFEENEMNRSSPPRVSIVTAVYSGAEYLTECIESVLAQTYQNWDYTIIDNCSTDNSLEIAEQYLARD